MVALRKIPLINWSDCWKLQNFEEISEKKWENWIFADIRHKEHVYALLSKSTMEPFFPKKTTLIFNIENSTKDGDWIIVNDLIKNTIDLCKLSINNRKKYLHLPFHKNEMETLKDSQRILGKIIQLRFSY